MTNPLPVEPFSVAEAARRTWPVLIEALPDAVCLVEPDGLRIVAANSAAGRLLGTAPADLVGRDMHEMAATPEDAAFWRELARIGGDPGFGHAGLVSDSIVVRADGGVVPVLRRVSRTAPAPGAALYVVAFSDRSEQQRIERGAEVARAELAATLESLPDGVLVVDLAGRIGHFNRRFAALWDVPEEMLLLHADDEIFDWMRAQVAEPAAYMRRLAEIDADELLHCTDSLELRSGAVLERVTLAQKSRGRTIGRVFCYRLSRAAN